MELLVELAAVVEDEVADAELVAVDNGKDLPPIVTLVAGALPKFKVAEVALALSLMVRVLPAVTVP